MIILIFKPWLKQMMGKKADVVDHLYTSERGVVFTFRGLSNDPVLEKVLDQLDAMGDVKATFFVLLMKLRNILNASVR